MTPPARPAPFGESERGKIARIKALKIAEREERERAEMNQLWQSSRDEMWIAEAIEVRESIRQQQEKQRLLDQVRMEVVVSDAEG